MNRMNSVISEEQENKVCDIIKNYDMLCYVYKAVYNGTFFIGKNFDLVTHIHIIPALKTVAILNFYTTRLGVDVNKFSDAIMDIFPGYTKWIKFGSRDDLFNIDWNRSFEQFTNLELEDIKRRSIERLKIMLNNNEYEEWIDCMHEVCLYAGCGAHIAHPILSPGIRDIDVMIFMTEPAVYRKKLAPLPSVLVFPFASERHGDFKMSTIGWKGTTKGRPVDVMFTVLRNDATMEDYMKRRSLEGSIRWLTIAQRPFVEIPSLKVLWKGAIKGGNSLIECGSLREK